MTGNVDDIQVRMERVEWDLNTTRQSLSEIRHEPGREMEAEELRWRMMVDIQSLVILSAQYSAAIKAANQARV